MQEIYSEILLNVLCQVLVPNKKTVKYFLCDLQLNLFMIINLWLIAANQRLDRKTLASILHNEFTDVKNIDCYLCGPSSMIDDIDRILLDLHVPNDQIKYEKWW